MAAMRRRTIGLGGVMMMRATGRRTVVDISSSRMRVSQGSECVRMLSGERVLRGRGFHSATPCFYASAHASTSASTSASGYTSVSASAASTTSAASTATAYPTFHQIRPDANDIVFTKNFISNTFLPSATDTWLDLHDPATNNLVTHVPQSTPTEISAAIDSAADAFLSWRNTTLLHRQQIMFRYVALIRKHWDRLAASITLEQGKTVADARGDVLRGLQVAETACGITTQVSGDVLEVAGGMETRTYREPLGVVAAVCPFNFPAMIPLWSIPLAVVTGNTIVVKPSERDPGATLILAELAREAGFPAGVISVIHGTHPTVNQLLDSPVVKAISFVGSNAAGEYIYERAAATGKRCQANLGAKNHAVVMPDCDVEQAVNGVVGAAFGAAGQRCMALSTVVFVDGEADGRRGRRFLERLVERAKGLVVDGGFEEGADVGPLISPEAVRRVEGLIERAVSADGGEEEGGGGAELVLDGRGYKPKKYPDGNWLAPTIISLRSPRLATGNTLKNIAYTTELFAPVLLFITVPSLTSATSLINANPYGNGTAIFTSSGPAAAKFQKEIEVGQVGVNVGIPVPLPMFSFSGNKKSVAGGGGHLFYGRSGVAFYTQTKTVTSYWKPYTEPVNANASNSTESTESDGPDGSDNELGQDRAVGAAAETEKTKMTKKTDVNMPVHS